MIRIPHAYDGGETFVAAGAVTSVTPANSPSCFSLRSIVRFTNNKVIESSAEAKDIVAQVEEQL